MTRKEALTELLDKVKEGVTTTDDTAKAFINDDPNNDDCVGHSVHAMRAYYGSMDAALSLFEAVLPGWGYELSKQPEDLVYVRVWIDISVTFGWSSDTPARALLIATLEALVGMEGR